MRTKIHILIPVFLFLCQVSLAQIPTNGLVAYYPFNGNASDESTYQNDGSVFGATLATDRCNSPDSAYYFDGSDDYILIPNSISLNCTQEITLCAWIKPEYFSGHGNNAIISKGYYSHVNPYYQYHLGVTGNEYPNTPGRFSFCLSINSDYKVVVADSIWNQDEWYFVTGTYDGNYMRIYVNGELAIEEYQTGLIDNYNEPLCIGRTYRYPGSQYTPGTIDDIRIFNRALTNEEIKQLYFDHCTPLPGGVIAFYPFNGNANDESGNGNDAIISGPVPTTDRCGRTNSAYYFDGIDDYINLVTNFDFPERTVNLWFSADIIDAVARHIYISDNPDLLNGFSQIKIMQTNGIKEIRSSAGIGLGTAEAHAEVHENEWHMITLVADEDSVKHYLDGQLIGKFSNSTFASGNGYQFALLGASRVFDRYFKGKMDDVIIYNRTLSSLEIQQLYSITCTKPDLIAYYPFNGNAKDESGNGNNGFVSGAVLTSDRCGVENSAYYFDGIDDYIVVSEDFLFTEVTVCGWIKADMVPQSGAVFFRSSDYAQDTWGIQLLDQLFLLDDIDDHNMQLYRTDINTKWHFFAAVLTSDLVNKLYVDGYLMGNGSESTDNWASYSSLFYIGKRGTTAYTGFFSGKIDDIRVYNRALSDSEILELYNTPCNQVPYEVDITGDTIICQGAQNVIYEAVSEAELNEYKWQYTGTGVKITGDSEAISVDFSKTSTSGTLKVTTSGNYISEKTFNLAINVKSCADTSSIDPPPSYILNIPNAISPNGDGINDVFEIKGLPVNSSLMVFNHNGKIVYETRNYNNNWNGIDNEGHKLETGTYWYIITISGLTQSFKGFLYIKR